MAQLGISINLAGKYSIPVVLTGEKNQKCVCISPAQKKEAIKTSYSTL